PDQSQRHVASKRTPASCQRRTHRSRSAGAEEVGRRELSGNENWCCVLAHSDGWRSRPHWRLSCVWPDLTTAAALTSTTSVLLRQNQAGHAHVSRTIWINSCCVM